MILDNDPNDPTPDAMVAPPTEPQLLTAIQEKALFNCVADMNKAAGAMPVEVGD